MDFLLVLLVLLLAVGAAAFAVGRWRARRFLRWIVEPAANTPPELDGAWGLAAAYTQRALVRSATRDSENSARLTALLAALDVLPEGMLLLDGEGRILFCNAAAARHFGLDPARDLGQHIVYLVRDPAFVAAFLRPQLLNEPLAMHGHADAPGRPVRLLVQRRPYGEGRSLLLSTDVTAQWQTEAMRRDFVANVSHEIRTPLTVLTGFIETLQNLKLPENEQAHYLNLMTQQAARMQALVADLLTLSRLEGNPPPGMGERTSLYKLTAQCAVETLALSERLHKAGTQHIDMTATPDFDLAGAASELHSAMSNLLANAVRYAGAHSRITARWSREADGGACFAVEDNGPGIAPEYLSRLTERFYRVDKSRTRNANDEGGTGLGLSIARHVAERHGGTLRIASELGQGSRFTLAFPKARVLTRQP